MLRLLYHKVLIILAAVLTGCTELPLPPEVEQASFLEHSLWRSGADTYATEEYGKYKAGLAGAKEHLRKEDAKFRLFRDYESVQSEFRTILEEGEAVLRKVQEQKNKHAEKIAGKKAFYQKKLEMLRQLSALINEGWLASRSLIKAEVLLKEIDSCITKKMYAEAEKRLDQVSLYASEATKAIYPVLNRYADRDQITRWQEWVRETVEQSRKKGNYAIIVGKLDRKLILYRAGRPYRTYEINIGMNGSRDKLYAGDRATPEGKYRIIKKLPKSRYHKALLINYPNKEDRINFAAARKKGLVPGNAKIGGLVEIHGGGKNGMTYGCIALENIHMDELYSIVDTDTAITIVGAVEYENSISSTINKM